MNPVLEKLDSLPIELRAIIEDDEIISIIDNICDEADIPYSWRGELIRATVRVLSGLMKPNEFVPFIIEEYNLETDIALDIASKINENIFSAVKPQLASLYNIEDKQIAKKLQVPKKPKTEELVEPSIPRRVDQSPYSYAYEPATAQDLMPKNVPNINIVHPSILNQNKGMEAVTASDDIVPQPPIHNQFATQKANDFESNIKQAPIRTNPVYNNQQAQPSDSALTGKLGGLRVDSYREQA